MHMVDNHFHLLSNNLGYRAHIQLSSQMLDDHSHKGRNLWHHNQMRIHRPGIFDIIHYQVSRNQVHIKYTLFEWWYSLVIQHHNYNMNMNHSMKYIEFLGMVGIVLLEKNRNQEYSSCNQFSMN